MRKSDVGNRMSEILMKTDNKEERRKKCVFSSLFFIVRTRQGYKFTNTPRIQNYCPNSSRIKGRDAQLLLLAGIIIILAFVAMSITIVEIANLGARTAGEEIKPALIRDYATIRAEFGKTLNESRKDSRNQTVLNASFSEAVNATAQSFRILEESRGITFYASLAANGTGAPKTEWDFVSPGGKYKDIPTLAFDGRSDGIVYNKTTGRIVGAVVYFYIADEQNELYEVRFYRFE